MKAMNTWNYVFIAVLFMSFLFGQMLMEKYLGSGQVMAGTSENVVFVEDVNGIISEVIVVFTDADMSSDSSKRSGTNRLQDLESELIDLSIPEDNKPFWTTIMFITQQIFHEAYIMLDVDSTNAEILQAGEDLHEYVLINISILESYDEII